MIFTMLIPEYLVGKALSEKIAAKTGVKLMEPEVERAGVGYEWEEIHSCMVNIGYFVIDFSDLLEDKEAPAPFEALAEPLRFRRVLLKFESISLYRFYYRCWALSSYQLWLLIDQNLIDIPKISSQQLEKLDRGDKLAKVLALVQITYLIVQLIVRKVVGLPSTQLEIAALAFSASSLVTYILYWSQPQGVDSLHVIKAKRLPDLELLLDMVQVAPVYLWTHARTRSKLDFELKFVSLPNDGISFVAHKFFNFFLSRRMYEMIGKSGEIIPLAFGAAIGGTLFGGLHCLAWNLKFPTSDERLIWRICSISTSGLPILSLVPLAFWLRMSADDETPRNASRISRFIVAFTLITLLATYILARLFLMVEVFRSLFYLPPEAFIDTWSGNFPHFG